MTVNDDSVAVSVVCEDLAAVTTGCGRVKVEPGSALIIRVVIVTDSNA